MIFDSESFTIDLFLRRMQGEKGRSLREAALECNVSVSTLSRIERGYVPELITFMRLCEWMQKSPSLYFISSPPEPPQSPSNQ